MDTHPSFDPFRWLRDPRVAETLRKVNALTVATDNLATALASLDGEVKTVVQTIADLLAKITASSDDPAVQAAADQINSEVAKIATAVSTAAPTPAPSA